MFVVNLIFILYHDYRDFAYDYSDFTHDYSDYTYNFSDFTNDFSDFTHDFSDFTHNYNDFYRDFFVLMLSWAERNDKTFLVDLDFTKQGDQLYITVCFWYLVKRDLSSVRYFTVTYTNEGSGQHSHVYLVWLY